MNYLEEIIKLKEEKNAIILAHYYQNKEIQDIADYLGDSYNLSVIAKNTTKDIIVFCGVDFMGETAKILSPSKKVLVPVPKADCAMAKMIDEESLKKYKEQHPEDIIMSYVNTTAKVKALSDVCVTSSNALKIIDKYRDCKILYCPDKNLAQYANRDNKYQITYWNGYCYIHNDLSLEDVKREKKNHPEALLVVHPEAPKEVLKEADFVGSTLEILKFCHESEKNAFIVGTECGIMHKLKKDNPTKSFFLLSDKLHCPEMKLISLKDIYECLKEEKYEVILDEDTINKAQKALNKMMELSR